MTINTKAERKRSARSLSNADVTGTGQALLGSVSHITFDHPGPSADQTTSASQLKADAGQRREVILDRLAKALAKNPPIAGGGG